MRQTATENLSDFFQMGWVEIFGSLSTPLIALFVAYIAYRQWRTSHENLKERLFDRRLKVFEDVEKEIGKAILGDSTQLVAQELLIAAKKARFLFGKDISDRIDIASAKALKIYQIERRLSRRTHSDSEFDRFSDEIDTDKSWMIQFHSNLYEEFSPYLDFSKHRD